MDYFLGSIHHVNAVPIDYDAAHYRKAVDSTGGTEEKFYARYYDQQFEMLQALKPRIVGHFDLCRLLSEDPGRDIRAWKSVWDRVVRNLQFIASYGGWLECNTSALRKGLAEPYPCRYIAETNKGSLWYFLGRNARQPSPPHRSLCSSRACLTAGGPRRP